MILHTPRLELRPWRMEDVEAAHKIYGDPHVTRYIGGHTPADLDEMRAHLQEKMARNAASPEGLGSWAVWHHEALIGNGLLKPLPGADGSPSGEVEVGWHLARAWWGRGFATEVGRRLLDHGLRKLKLSRIHAVMEPPNAASQRVAVRLGMVHTGQTTAFYDGLTLEQYTTR